MGSRKIEKSIDLELKNEIENIKADKQICSKRTMGKSWVGEKSWIPFFV
jgi:hypothetical protein